VPLESLTTFRFAEQMIPKLAKALKAIGSERTTALRKLEDIFGDPVSLANNYIEPYCQQFNPADFEDESRYLVREYLTSRLEHFFGGDPKVKDRHLLILADSGMGKTSCLMMLKLAELNAFWPKQTTVQLFKLGKGTLDEIARLKGAKTILLLDALDEDPLARGRVTARLTEVLVATQKFYRVVITCRTQFFSAGTDPFDRRGVTEVGGFVCPVVYLSLFDDSQVLKYLNRRFSGDKTLIERALPILSQMKSLKFRPMLLAHIDDLMESQTKTWTPPAVYEALISAWLHRERRKMSAQRPPEDVPSLNDLMKACEVLARIMFYNSQTTIKTSEIENAMTFNANIGELSQLDITGRSLLNRNSHGDFRFAHYSVQEYLFSRAMLSGDLGAARPRQFSPTAQVLEFVHYSALNLSAERRRSLRFRFLNMDGLKIGGLNLSQFDFSTVEADKLHFAQVEATELNMSSTTLTELSVKDCTLQQVNFEGATLRSSKLAKTDLSFSSYADAKLDSCHLSDCSMKQSNLTSARLSGCHVSRCNLSGSRIQSTQVDKTIFASCNLSEAEIADSRFMHCKFDEISWLECRPIRNVVFQKCEFYERVMALPASSSVRYIDCKFNRAAFVGRVLSGSVFERCQFVDCTFDIVSLEDARFTGCDFSRSAIPDAAKELSHLVDCKFLDPTKRTGALGKFTDA